MICVVAAPIFVSFTGCSRAQNHSASHCVMSIYTNVSSFAYVYLWRVFRRFSLHVRRNQINLSFHLHFVSTHLSRCLCLYMCISFEWIHVALTVSFSTRWFRSRFLFMIFGISTARHQAHSVPCQCRRMRDERRSLILCWQLPFSYRWKSVWRYSCACASVRLCMCMRVCERVWMAEWVYVFSRENVRVQTDANAAVFLSSQEK